jgi:hypothetical protein
VLGTPSGTRTPNPLIAPKAVWRWWLIENLAQPKGFRHRQHHSLMAIDEQFPGTKRAPKSWWGEDLAREDAGRDILSGPLL